MDFLNRQGSVEDSRCSLSYITKNTPENIERLKASILDEKGGQNRVTIIKMLEAKLKKLTK